MKTLFISACPRHSSRTLRLANILLSQLEGDIEILDLSQVSLPDLDDAMVTKRNEDSHNRHFSDDYYNFAKQFAAADQIVIAAPFWDMSFPAILKKYIETITVSGLTFRYSDQGIPIGLCKAKKLYYVTTAGGTIFDEAYGYGYIKLMATGMYGIPECQMFKAENLDIIGNDVEAIMQEAEEKIRQAFR